jgi:hypothetical protein
MRGIIFWDMFIQARERNSRVNGMSEMNLHAILILFLLAAALGSAASAQTTSDTAFSQVVVSKVTINPQVLMVGDTGTITVTVQNTGTEAVDINRATLYLDGIHLLNEGAYDSHVTLGPGNSKDFTFFVTATGRGGLYQPRFYMDFLGSGFLSYLIPLRIDNSGLQVSVIDAPDYFSTERKDQITLLVGNPRDVNLTGITITAEGEGVKIIQSNYFVGDLGAGQSTQVVFDVIPSRATTLTFHTSYRNGFNVHGTDTQFPLQIDNSRRSADLVINNVKLTPSGASYQLDADITNGGLDNAKSVIITVQSPAQPVDPYPSYVIGTLAVDDFSSFSLTFTAPQTLSTLPVLIQWKDSDGNAYQETLALNLRTAAGGSGTGPSQGGGGGLQTSPIAIVLIVAAAVALFIAWRKGIFTRMRKRGKESQGDQKVRR